MKKLNTSLLKHIIKTDFFILENRKSHDFKKFNLISNKNFNILDVVELNLSLKQFIRILQFTKKKFFNINIIDFNRQYLKIFENFYKKNLPNIKNKLIFNDSVTYYSQIKDFSMLYIILNIKNNLKRDLLVNEVNSIIDNIDTGKYKIFNNISSFKKLIVFLSIMQNILTQHK